MAFIGSIVVLIILAFSFYLLLASTGLFTRIGEVILSKKDKIEEKMDEEWKK